MINMKLYRIMDYDGLKTTLNEGVIKTNSDVFEPNSGWGTFNNCSYMNTFTVEQNKSPHFYPFAIDAAHYMIKDRNSPSDYFCVIDIPDDYVEKGYGFYPQKISPEYVSNQTISSESIVFWTSNKEQVANYVLNDLEESIKWYSTVGKAIYMCMDRGFLCQPLCGTLTMGGFIFSFEKFLEFIISEYSTKDFTQAKEVISGCTKLNEYYYSLLDFLCNRASATDFNMIQGKFNSDQIKSAEEAGILFGELEKKYTFIDTTEEEAKLKVLLKSYGG